jgi:hypothetical protein
MEFIEYAFPELEDVKVFDKQQQQTLIEEIAEMSDYKDQVLTILLEQKVYEALEIFKIDSKKVIVHPSYTYDNQGYKPQNAMVWVNDFVDPFGNGTKEAKFQTALDKSLDDLAPMLKNVAEFDVLELKAKYGPKVEPVVESEHHASKRKYEM